MLAFHHAPSSSPNYGYYLAVPSPLSPRSANIYGRHARMSDNEKSQTGSCGSGQENSESERSMPFSKRNIKRAPVQKADELREKRRRNFLKKVEEQREEKRFESRGEDIMRLDFIQRQRDWEAERAREAAFVPSQEEVYDEDEVVAEYDLPGYVGSQMQISSSIPAPAPEDEVEDFVRDEEAELEAMLEYMPNANEDARSQNSDNLWSDDADYEELFEEVLSMETGNVQQQFGQSVGFAQQQQAQQLDEDEMDMS